MEIEDVRFDGVVAILRMPEKELRHLRNFLDNCTMEYNGSTHPELVEADKYVRLEFFKKLDSLVEGLPHGP